MDIGGNESSWSPAEMRRWADRLVVKRAREHRIALIISGAVALLGLVAVFSGDTLGAVCCGGPLLLISLPYFLGLLYYGPD